MNLFRKKFGFFTLVAGGIMGSISVSTAEPITKVWVSGNSIFYQGPLSDMANQSVASWLKKKPSLQRLVIDSSGGDVDLGIQLGELVHDYEIDVEVDKKCFSSCANYVFPAGKSKYVHTYSKIGWHGGALQKDFTVPQSQQKQFEAYLKIFKEKENNFYSKINVDQLINTYGQSPQYTAKDRCIGWTYTDDALARFGVSPIYNIDGPRKSFTQYKNQCVFEIGANEIQFPNSKVLAGEYTYGPEVSAFQAYGSKKTYWLDSYDKDIRLVLEQAALLNARQLEKPYAPIYIKAEMYCSDQKASEEFVSDYDGVCTVYRLDDLSFLSQVKG